MNGEIQQTHNMHCITSVTPTICKLMGIEPPAVSDQNCLDHVIQAARCNGVENVEKCLVFAPDAIGIQMFIDYRQVFATVLEHAPIKVPLLSVIPPITPVCFASMFTGAQPWVHGLQKKEKPVLTCDTIFDALIRAEKKVAIVSAKEQSIDLIFRRRKMKYFSEIDGQAVTRRTIEIIKSDNYDFIVAYSCEYDDILHRMTPFCPEAIQALKHHINAFDLLAKSVNVYWRTYNRMILFASDHGAHIDPQSGKGVHGENIPEDMHVQHYFGIKRGKTVSQTKA